MKRLLSISSVLAIVVGVVLVAGGIWGLYFTYKNVVQEKIVTPEDASISNQPVRGPFTLKAQANIIRKHTLTSTGGKTFAEMPRQIEKLDADGKPILGADGKPVMMANTARDMWITATTLTTALNLGILSFAFSGLAILLGLISLWIGIIFCVLSKKS
ncbi:MAG TPA: hypothetical protein VIH31_00735 [Candidatus Paceibacterota bacterium]|uniref:Aromatic ring-opening dioxygenase LigA n=1 Tax=uncultured Parcubacteria bacterium Rifle_16ft_4_minimus_2958 TaxID=1665137 RepID=A0A0H4T558_9BACT|nr:hypothetical protein [uncultured Parcubacteria bacterium Rifle_16ft_4_minimus_2958]